LKYVKQEVSGSIGFGLWSQVFDDHPFIVLTETKFRFMLRVHLEAPEDCHQDWAPVICGEPKMADSNRTVVP
jgi:hypothetical protein